MKTLVVYFSRKGYVKKLAAERARELGAELLELRTPERTGGWLGFWWCGRFGMHRWGMALEPVGRDVSEYDRVVVCSPIWVFSVCAPVREFLKQSAGRIRAADYMLVHFSLPQRYDRAVNSMDALAGVTHDTYESVQCMWGKILGRKTFTRGK